MLPTSIEINDFIDKNLAVKLKTLNSQRKKTLLASFTGCVSILLVMGVMIGVNFATINSPNHTLILIGSIIAVFVFTMILAFYNRNNSVPDFESTFKEEIIQPLIHFINPEFRYKSDSHINHNEFLQSGFFENDSYNYTGNDQLIGKYNEVLFQFCDLYVTKTPTFKTKNESDYEVFSGNFFMAKFNKPFKSETYLVPNYSITENLMGSDLDTDSFMVSNSAMGEKVILEDPEFNKLFKVYSSDQIEARYILTPSFMERIKHIQRKTNGKLFVSFRKDLIFIANNNEFDYFEPDFYKNLDSKVAILEYYQEIKELLTIIDDLKLNIKIWKE